MGRGFNSRAVFMTLREVVSNLNAYDESSFILVPPNGSVSPETAAMVIPIPEDPGAELGISGFDYLIEIYHAKDVIEAWMSQRDGKAPNPEEAIQAILYYQENDAYLLPD